MELLNKENKVRANWIHKIKFSENREVDNYIQGYTCSKRAYSIA